MKRSPYRPHALPLWLRETLALAGLLLTIGALTFAAIYGYSVQAGLAP